MFSRAGTLLGIGLAVIVAGWCLYDVNGDRRAVELPGDRIAANSGREAGLADQYGRRLFLTQQEAAVGFRSELLPEGVNSILSLNRTLRHGEYLWNDADVAPGPVRIWVDLRRQMISIFRGGHEIGTSVIVYGGPENETPIGVFEILSKHRFYRSKSYDADMPYSLFISRDGVALHASVMHPRHATHGCIGLPEGFAQQVFAEAQVGATVEIVRSDAEATANLLSTSTAPHVNPVP